MLVEHDARPAQENASFCSGRRMRREIEEHVASQLNSQLGRSCLNDTRYALACSRTRNSCIISTTSAPRRVTNRSESQTAASYHAATCDTACVHLCNERATDTCTPNAAVHLTRRRNQ